MYLTRVLLTGEKLHNPYEIHRALWHTFPQTPEQNRDFLFRIEKRESQQIQVLMQSQRLPSDVPDLAQLLAYKPIALSFAPDRALRFLLVANPIKTITDEDGRLNRKGKPQKCRVPLIAEEAQVDWLKRKLRDAAAFEPASVEIDKLPPINFRKNNTRGRIQPYTFKGVLQVQQPELLLKLVQQGIGPAKAFGCGLLSLAILS